MDFPFPDRGLDVYASVWNGSGYGFSRKITEDQDKYEKNSINEHLELLIWPGKLTLEVTK